MAITEIDELEFDTIQYQSGAIIKLDATHFAIAYRGASNVGEIKTFSIDGSFDNITEINNLTQDATRGIWNSLALIDSTHFILAYGGVGDDGFIKTFSFDGAFDNVTQIDSLEHDTGNGTFNSLIKIDATHFILAYAGTGFDGFITTFSIDGGYNITKINSLEHDIANSSYNSLVMIDSTHFFLSYAGTINQRATVKTFSIDGSHVITEIDSLEHDATNSSFQSSVVKIDATHFMVAYKGAAGDGFIKTFTIDGSHVITQTDSLEHDGDLGEWNSLVQIDSTNFILAYQGGAGTDGIIKLFSIDGSFNITAGDSLTHDVAGAVFTSFISIDSTHFAIAYMGADVDGFMKTFTTAEPVTDTGNMFQMFN